MATKVNQKIILNTIIKNYGSINNFIEKNYPIDGLSRSSIYYLCKYKLPNPSVRTLYKVATLLKLDPGVALVDYIKNNDDVIKEKNKKEK